MSRTSSVRRAGAAPSIEFAEPPQENQQKAPARPRRGFAFLLLACSLLLLLATVPPLVNLGRYQRRIAGAISRSIGRPVSMDSISLRLLPWPAFQLRNLTVGEEPGFGAEPALRAPEVVLEPRLLSLWRGRFELSRVALTDASVNLVHAPDGRWNVSSVLLQASHLSNAPTGQKGAGPAPRFPYLEATGTRINFKRGVEKLPYSLLNADFSMYLLRPEVWQLKLEGQPVRTDLELSLDDTGILRLGGELHRASAFGTMPLSLTGEWSHAPLGQLSRLLLGRDAGWRGDIDVTAQLAGEINHLDVRSHVLIANLHRQEFTPQQPLSLDATCSGLYSRAAPAADAFRCRWPVNDGALLLAHDPADPPGSLTLAADKLPAGFLAAALGVLRPGAAAPAGFAGQLTGSFLYDPALHALNREGLTGSADIPELSIASAGQPPLLFQQVHLQASGIAPTGVQVTAAPLALGAPAGMLLSAELSAQGYALHANGAGMLAPLTAAAKSLYLPGLQHLSSSPVKEGTAQLALTCVGPWLGAEPPEVTGTVELANVRWSPPWLPVPVELAAATANISPGSIHWTTRSATLSDDSGLRISGDAVVPVRCDGDCVTQFSLQAPSLDAAALEIALVSRQRPLLSALLSRAGVRNTAVAGPALAGSLHAGVLTLGRMPIRDALLTITTASSPASPAITIESLDGHALGGLLHLAGTVSLADGAPLYALRVRLAGASAEQAAALWGENWGPGALGGTAELSLSGIRTAELLRSATGSFQASWLNGDLSPALPQFSSWDASGRIGANGLTLAHSTVSGIAGAVTGTIDWSRTLALELRPTPGTAPAAITGSLAAPALAPAAASP